MDAAVYLSELLSYLKLFLTCHKKLRAGAEGFTSHPKEVVLRMFMAIKNLSLSAGFGTLGPIASTLIITSPITTIYVTLIYTA
jgi:hypothetical protein